MKSPHPSATQKKSADELKRLMPDQIQSPADIADFELKDLETLADDVREFLIKTVSKTGGHIGANLGTVDLSIALHKSFESPKDQFIFDTGHQGYTHKLMTGRAHLFPSLNQYGGMNRFLTLHESEHDAIEASHAGTSLSVALGLALSNKIQGKDNWVVAIIGDGALVEGMALESLNHLAVEEDLKLIVILNDNGFAISPGFGALHECFQNSPESKQSAGPLFEALGMHYEGPVNGHSMSELLEAIEKSKQSSLTPIIHVKTQKGYGLEPAKDHPVRMHFSFPFDPETGKPKGAGSPKPYQDYSAQVILEHMRNNDKIACITPSTLYATGLQPLFDEFPERCFDPGMAEQHAMTLAVGLSLGGMTPIIAYQSTFMQRAFDQLYHDICFLNTPCLILAMRSGFSGYDNATHHGIYDFSYLAGLPNLKMLYPKDRHELERMVQDNLQSLTGPTFIGMPYGPADSFEPEVINESPESFSKPQKVIGGEDLYVITIGNKFQSSRDAVLQLREQGISAGLINLRYLKPLPTESLIDQIRTTGKLVIVEEGVLSGGIGAGITTELAELNIRPEILRIGVSCRFVETGSNQELCASHQLDTAGILKQIKSKWEF